MYYLLTIKNYIRDTKWSPAENTYKKNLCIKTNIDNLLGVPTNRLGGDGNDPLLRPT